MALSLEGDLEKAKALLQRIRYKGGKISFATRNHFPEVDWRANNEAAGFLREITRDVAGDLAQVIHKPIDKKTWYETRSMADIKGFPSEVEGAALLARLREAGKDFEVQVATVVFVPWDVLPSVLDRIPNGTVANVVREVLPDKGQVITHQTLIVVKDGKRYVREAAYGRAVEETPALERIQRFVGSNAGAKWKTVGFNLEKILEPR